MNVELRRRCWTSAIGVVGRKENRGAEEKAANQGNREGDGFRSALTMDQFDVAGIMVAGDGGVATARILPSNKIR